MKISPSLLKNNSAHITGFITALLLYLGAFLAFYKTNSLIKIKEDGDKKYTIKLSSIANITNETPSPPTPAKPTPPKPPKPIPVPPKPTPVPVPPKPKNLPIPPKPTPKPPKPQQTFQKITTPPKLAKAAPSPVQSINSKAQIRFNEGLDDRFLKALRDTILKYNKYPRIARARRLEGVVVLSFNLHTNGSVSDIKILDGSINSSLLQEAAKNAILKAQSEFLKPKKMTLIRVPIR